METKTILNEDELICWDCKKKLKEGDECMPYETDCGPFLKCRSCHLADPVLRNFREIEVYSRIVGYIRPTKQWNKGKSEEWKDRKVYKI